MIHVHSGTLPIVMQGLLDLESLGAIEVLVDPKGKTLPELVPLFQRIQQTKALLICGDIDVEATKLLLGELSPRGLALLVKVETEEQADAVLAEMRAYLDSQA